MTHDQRGQAGGLEGLVFGLLLFVVGTLVITSVWGAVDAKFAAAQAAREAARAYVESGGDSVTADAAARRAAMATLTGHHRVSGADVALSGNYGRCALVTYRVTVPVRVVIVPFIQRSAKGFRMSSVHSERVDPYRSGVAGTANCQS